MVRAFIPIDRIVNDTGRLPELFINASPPHGHKIGLRILSVQERQRMARHQKQPPGVGESH